MGDLDRTLAGLSCPFQFSTKYLDEETGLYYYGYRYYSPVCGRWLSRDPIGEKGGTNVYAALRNNLIAKIDYLGLSPVADRVGDDIKALARIEAARNAGNSPLIRDLFGYLGKTIFDPGLNDQGKNMFIYTCKCGWLDLGHFFTNAQIVRSLTLVPPSQRVKFTVAGSIAIENAQKADKDRGGEDLGGWATSAWTIEDLPSNEMGANFGNAIGEKGSWGENLDLTKVEFAAFLKKCRPVRDKGLDGWIMRWDAAGLSMAADRPGFEADPRTGIYPYNMESKPKKTKSHDCLCDKNDQPYNNK